MLVAFAYHTPGMCPARSSLHRRLSTTVSCKFQLLECLFQDCCSRLRQLASAQAAEAQQLEACPDCIMPMKDA